jgi:hypothetical protein
MLLLRYTIEFGVVLIEFLACLAVERFGLLISLSNTL